MRPSSGCAAYVWHIAIRRFCSYNTSFAYMLVNLRLIARERLLAFLARVTSKKGCSASNEAKSHGI